MQTALPLAGLEGYRSKSRRAGVASEAWGLTNLYCPNCHSDSLTPSATNTQAIDYTCPRCRAPFQLKAQSRVLAGRIVDAAYSAMVRAIQEDRTPNLFALHYEPVGWKVANLILIPHFAFPLSAIEKRKPLAPRRAGLAGSDATSFSGRFRWTREFTSSAVESLLRLLKCERNMLGSAPSRKSRRNNVDGLWMC